MWFPQIIMTLDQVWNPLADCFASNEDGVQLSLTKPPSNNPSLCTISVCSHELAPLDDLFNFHPNFQVSAVQALYQKGTVTPEDLARCGFIGIETARRRIENTTQHGVRNYASTQGSQRLKHTNYQFKYRHLCSTVYTSPSLQRPSLFIRTHVGKFTVRIFSGRSFIR
jgi:hypothetical protein